MTAVRRHTQPRELPVVVGFQQYARFERIDHATNCERFYRLAVQPTLLGDVAVVRTWGRIGTTGTSLTSTFTDRAGAQPLVERLIRRRIRRKYELMDWT